jgi:hypothetical protein
LLDLLREYRDKAGGVVAGEKTIAFQLALRQLKPWFNERFGVQQDSPEAFYVIMECLGDELTVVQNMPQSKGIQSERPLSFFDGSYQNVMMCNHHSCKHKSVKFDPFTNFELPIPDARTTVDQTVIITKAWQDTFLPFEIDEQIAPNGRSHLVVEKINRHVEGLKVGSIIQSVNMLPVHSRGDVGRAWYALQTGHRMHLQTLVPRNFVSLSECFAAFSAPEEISDFKCEKCGHAGVHKQLRPCSLPDSLVVTLKRFAWDFDQAKGDVVKIKRTDPVEFPTDGLELKNNCVHFDGFQVFSKNTFDAHSRHINFSVVIHANILSKQNSPRRTRGALSSTTSNP